MSNVTMSQKIKTLLHATKCSSKDLAEFVNTNPSTVSHWLTRNVTPSSDFLPGIATFFGLTMEELYTEHPEEYLESARITKRETEAKEENLRFISYNKNFSDTFKKSLNEISADAKLLQDTEELFSLFQHLDPWRRHVILAYTYEQNEIQRQSGLKSSSL